MDDSDPKHEQLRRKTHLRNNCNEKNLLHGYHFEMNDLESVNVDIFGWSLENENSPGTGIPNLTITRSHHILMFITTMPILMKRYLHIKTAPGP